MAKAHVKNYMKHFGYGEQDIILCEACHRKAIDLHHIKYKSRGGGDEVQNVIALCRKCHDLAHNEYISEGDLRYIHNNVLNGHNIKFVH